MTTEPEFITRSTVQLYKTNATDLDVARAAWVSQNAEAHKKEAEEGRVEGLINFLVKNHHTSPLESGSFTFIIDTPIFVAREFHRHRTWSFSELSSRYIELDNRFYIPDSQIRPLQQTGKVGNYDFTIGTQDQKRAVKYAFESVVESAWNEYQWMLEDGVAKEVARMVLPVTKITSFWATANPLNVLRFLSLRTADDALYEIRQVAAQMEEEFKKTMPLVWKAWDQNGRRV